MKQKQLKRKNVWPSNEDIQQNILSCYSNSELTVVLTSHDFFDFNLLTKTITKKAVQCKVTPKISSLKNV